MGGIFSFSRHGLQEESKGRTTAWRWLLLDDRSVLEVLRHTMFLFSAARNSLPGTPPYALLTGQGQQDGLLRVFEARVRAGTIAGMPVTYEHDGKTYQVRSAGVFSAHFNGMTDAEVWVDVSENAGG